MDGAFHVESGLSGDGYAVPFQFTAQYAASGGHLFFQQCAFTELFGPVGHQNAVDRASDGVFVDAATWGEVAADEVEVIARCSNDDAKIAEFLEFTDVRLCGFYRRLVSEDDQVIGVFGDKK